MMGKQPIESWLRDQAEVATQRGYNGHYHERMAEAADRIRKLESELAALRQQQGEPVAILNLCNSEPEVELLNIADMKNGDKLYREAAPKQQEASAMERFEHHECYSEQDPIERLRFFCSLAMNGQDWLDVEQFFDDLRQQQGEPVACEKMRFALENCRLFAARNRKESWAILILGFCAEAGVAGNITRDYSDHHGEDWAQRDSEYLK